MPRALRRASGVCACAHAIDGANTSAPNSTDNLIVTWFMELSFAGKCGCIVRFPRASSRGENSMLTRRTRRTRRTARRALENDLGEASVAMSAAVPGRLEQLNIVPADSTE